MIKNFIFDFGKVLVQFSPRDLTKIYTDDERKIEKVSKLVFNNEIYSRLDRGQLIDEQAREIIKNSAPDEICELALKVYDNWMQNLVPVEGMEKIIKDIKKRGYKVYLLSNISIGFAENYKSLSVPARILKDFDGIVFSGPLHMAKPDKKIFLYALNKYSLKAEECLFVDDKHENILGAQSVGISTYQFDSDSAKFKKYIEENIF